MGTEFVHEFLPCAAAYAAEVILQGELTGVLVHHAVEADLVVLLGVFEGEKPLHHGPTLLEGVGLRGHVGELFQVSRHQVGQEVILDEHRLAVIPDWEAVLPFLR